MPVKNQKGPCCSRSSESRNYRYCEFCGSAKLHPSLTNLDLKDFRIFSGIVKLMPTNDGSILRVQTGFPTVLQA